MNTRPSLENLAGKISDKGAGKTEARKKKPDEEFNNRGEKRKQPPAILFRLDYDARKAFKLAAGTEDMTLQDALLEAANEWMNKRGYAGELTFSPDFWSGDK